DRARKRQDLTRPDQMPPAYPLTRQASNTATATALLRLRLRWPGSSGRRTRRSGGKLSRRAGGRPADSLPKTRLSPARQSTLASVPVPRVENAKQRDASTVAA